MDKFIKQNVVISIVLLLSIFALSSWVGLRGCAGNKEVVLYGEIQNYYDWNVAEAAHISLKLVRPNLDERDNIRYTERISILDKCYVRSELSQSVQQRCSPGFSFDDVMDDIGFLEGTLKMRQALNKIDLLLQRREASRPLKDIREDFQEVRKNFEEALADAKQELGS